MGRTWAEDDHQASLRLSLKDALKNVDGVNLQVLMANARLQGAIARISQQESDLLPHLEGTVGGARQTSDMRAGGMVFPTVGPHIGPYNNFDARLRVTVALFDPSAFERFQAAKKGADLSRAELEKTREDILALVAELFVDAQRKEQTVMFFKTVVDKERMAYDLSEDNFKQGTGTELDSNRNKTELDQSKYLYTQAKRQSQDADLDLKAALQISFDRPLQLVDDNDFAKSLEDNSAVIFTNTANADMMLAASQLAAGKADQRKAYADFLPKVSGSADYGRSGASPVRGSNTYFVGAQVTVPIWEGGSQQAQLKEAKSEVKADEENLAYAAQQERVKVAKARTAILEVYDLRQAKFQQRQTAQRAFQVAVRAQEIGSGTGLQMMQARSDLAMAQDEFNEAQAAWVMAHIDLLHAQGRLRDLIK